MQCIRHLKQSKVPSMNFCWLALIVLTCINDSLQTCSSLGQFQQQFGGGLYRHLPFRKYIQCQNVTVNSTFYKTIEPLFIEGVTAWLEINSIDNPVISSGAFGTLNRLPDLRINGAGVYGIQAGAFDGLWNLTQLSLKNNKISSVKANTFKNLNGLVRLDLGFNNIRDFNDKCFFGLKKLYSLLLNNNILSTLSPILFQELESLEILDLSFNQIATIDDSLFRKLYNLTILWLNNNNLNRFDGNVLSTNFYLTSLYLDNNYLPALTNLSFSKSVISVNFSFNQMQSFSFIQFTEVKLFDLRHNSIQALNTNSFVNLSIQELYLDNNYVGLQPIGLDSFSHLSKLEIISLEDNHIKQLTPNVFKNNTKLRKLSLAKNSLTNIDAVSLPIALQELNLHANAFDSTLNISNLVNLKFLELSRNNLIQLPYHFLEGFKWLSRANFSYNQLSKISIGCFKDLTMLKDLDLSHNKISFLEIGVFAGVDKLDRLNISDNNLNILNDGVFHNLKNMRELNIAYNNLSFLSVENTLSHLSSLREIGLAGNNWSCQLLTSIIKEYPRIRFIRGDDFNMTNVNGVICTYMKQEQTGFISTETDVLTTIAPKLNITNTLLFIILILLLLNLLIKHVSIYFKTGKLGSLKSEQELQLLTN